MKIKYGLQQRFSDIKKIARLEDVVQRYTTIAKDGDHYRGLCCLQGEESHEGLVINPQTQFFFCFRCDEGGDVIVFLNLMEKISPYKALEKLEREYGHNKQNEAPEDADSSRDL